MANTQEDVAALLDKIHEYLNSSGKDVHEVVDKMKKHFESKSGSDKTDAVCSSVKKIAGSIDSFKSGDPMKIWSSVIDITSSISAIVPGVGPLPSVVCSLYSALISALGSETSMSDVVKKAVKEALDNYEDSELRAKVHGTMRVYENLLAYLKFDTGTTLNEKEIDDLQRNVPVVQGIEILGIIETKVNAIAKKKDLIQGARAIAYTNLYVKLALVRSLILAQIQALIISAGGRKHTAEGINRIAKREDERDKDFIKYLTTPTYETAYLFVQLSPSKEPLLSEFLNKHGLQFQNLQELNGTLTFSPEKWNDWYISLDFKSRPLQGGKGPNEYIEFCVSTVSFADNVFHIHPQRWPDCYVFMLEHSECWNSKVKRGSDGEWKFIRFEDGKYMFSPVQWPTRFVYMRNNLVGTCRGYEGDPGIQGHWIIRRVS